MTAAAEARARMVAAIAAEGSAVDPAVLAALARVPREAFVPRFWAAARPGEALRAFEPGPGGTADPAALRLVYDKDRALAIRHDPGTPAGTTSTASAPALMAVMLELLALRPGLRVLEIGTGSGYNAALLAELVGEPGLVTTVDIDAGLAARAARRLAAHGYGGVHVVVGDATADPWAGGPFDRVVATVGCVDLAPAWLAGLAPGGYLLVPLQHGPAHPLVRARPADGGARGDVVGRSGFVAVQGRQGGHSPWTEPGPTVGPRRQAVLPEALAADLAGRPSDERAAGWWDLGFYLSIADRRAGLPDGLADGTGSGAWIPPGSDRVAWYGPAGDGLRDRLVALAAEWSGAGCPAATEFACRFTAPAGPGTVGRAGRDAWVVDRLDYRQHLRRRDLSG